MVRQVGKLGLVFGVGLLGSWLLAAAAAAFTSLSAPFSTQDTIVGNFPTCSESFGTVGPFGGLDDGTNVFFTDFCNKTLYRFSDGVLTSGGSATSPSAQSANGLDGGLAVSQGSYFGIRQLAAGAAQAGLYAFDPHTLALTTPAPLVPASSLGPGTPIAVAADPQSSDLYVSSESGVFRVQNPTSGSPTVTKFASGEFDGIAFNNSGSALYVAANKGPMAGHVFNFGRNGATVADINVGDGPDGLAVAPAGQAVSGIDVSGNVFVNKNDGTVERIDVDHGNSVSVVASGGERGDLAFVDSQGGLDVAQVGSYVRLTRTAGPSVFGTRPRNTARPVISGTPTVGNALMCSTGAWTGAVAAYSYGWDRDGTPIAGASGAGYTVAAPDRGHTFTCAITASNAAGSATATSDPVTVPGPLACTLAARMSTIRRAVKHRPRKVTKAIKLTVRCDQATRGRITGAIRETLRAGTKRRKAFTVRLPQLSVTVSPVHASIVTHQLGPAILKALSGAKRATASFSLRVTNPNGTATAVATVKLR